MSGERLGKWSLRLDAIYCLLLGVTLAVVAPFVESRVSIPLDVLRVVGLAVASWGAFVWWAAMVRPLRSVLRLVMVANLLASVALAATGLVAEPVVLTAAALVLSVDVGVFAISQRVALQKTRLA